VEAGGVLAERSDERQGPLTSGSLVAERDGRPLCIVVAKAGARAGRQPARPRSRRLDQAALTSIVLGVAACRRGDLTSSMPSRTSPPLGGSTPSGRVKFRFERAVCDLADEIGLARGVVIGLALALDGETLVHQGHHSRPSNPRPQGELDDVGAILHPPLRGGKPRTLSGPIRGRPPENLSDRSSTS